MATKHHTKEKGDLAVLAIQLDLHKQGFLILEPKTEHAAFDLVGYKDNKFYRFQIKYRSIQRNGCLDINARSSWADKNGTHNKKLDKSDIDYFAVYCPENEKCYYIDVNSFKEFISLRIVDGKRKSSIQRNATDYHLVN